jgi:hypothetical protein
VGETALGLMVDSRTHLLIRAPLKSCIEMQAKTMIVTTQRKQMLAMAGYILKRTVTRF